MKQLFTAAFALAIAAAPAHAGPPWISVEYPANPHHASTRGALALVHTYHHSTAITPPMAATLEGLVDGQRVSRPIELESTNRRGVYAVRGDVPRRGTWVLVVTLSESGTYTATVIAGLSGNGVTSVQVPANERDGWTVPRRFTSEDIDAALQRTAGLARVSAMTGTASGAVSRAGLLGLIPAGLLLVTVIVRRRARHV